MLRAVAAWSVPSEHDKQQALNDLALHLASQGMSLRSKWDDRVDGCVEVLVRQSRRRANRSAGAIFRNPSSMVIVIKGADSSGECCTPNRVPGLFSLYRLTKVSHCIFGRRCIQCMPFRTVAH